MARIRSVKPDYWDDEKIALLCRDARLLFIGLWNHADDEGRMRANHKYVKSKVFPYDDDVSVDSLLAEIAALRLIVLYRSGDQEYLWVRNFRKHQKIDRPQLSNLPAPPVECSETDPAPGEVSAQLFDEHSPNDQRAFAAGMEWNGEGMEKEGTRESVSLPGECSMFTEFFESYPRKQDRDEACAEWRKLRLNPQEAGEVLKGLRAQVAGGAFNCEFKYIPLASTYLRKKRWKDAPPPAPEPEKPVKTGRIRAYWDEERNAYVQTGDL